ncbi:FecR protein [Posidoniimonas polymericola]|uniref:FecR protein n=1 Tax=Posidoniimonas polymericola TaxID=2528002 RepID=A0A5C5ZFI4_9BACT|nr:FecR domain-containing protein [Posidoniimonas polymericola]TWT85948.1 FecR protein [Posidoniimonas polymericola]
MESNESRNPAGDEPRRQLHTLLAKMWDNELTAQDAVELGELLQSHPGLRQEYLEAKLSQETLVDLCKRWDVAALDYSPVVGTPAIGAKRSSLASLAGDPTAGPAAQPPRRRYRPTHWLAGLSAAAAAVAVGVWIGQAWQTGRTAGGAAPPAEAERMLVARVVDAVSSEMAELVPEFRGREIAAGEVLELESGLTELRFHSGANALLAGPARMTIEGPLKVKLGFGRLTVRMDEGVDGFQVVTPDGQVTDLGTAFGVSVSDGQQSQVSVFEGEVEYQSEKSKEPPTKLVAGEAVRFGPANGPEALTDVPHLAGLKDMSLKRPCVRLPAYKDSYVRNRELREHNELRNFGSDSELLIKYEVAEFPATRRVWLGFDLSGIACEDLIGARLRLSVLPNHLAEEYRQSKNQPYTESDTAWQFEVAGLWDEFYDDWQEDQITWMNAPGNAPNEASGRLTGPHAPVSLGTFSIRGSGQRGDEIVVVGARLLEFLRNDSDGKVTLVVSRRTPSFLGAGQDVIVHGFASREHPDLAPPTLELWGKTAASP